MRPIRLLGFLAMLALASAGCSGGPSTGGSGTCRPQGSILNLTARSTRFTADCLAAPGNAPFTVNFDNQDAGVPHNFGVFDKDPRTDRTASELFRGDLVTGPSMTIYRIGTLPTGRLYFRCDVHPDQMFGTLVIGG